MRKHSIFLFLLLIPAFFACEKVIEFDGEIVEPKIVVNALFNTEDELRIHLSRSLAVVDRGDLDNITNATVELLDADGNKIVDMVHDTGGYYHADGFIAKANTEYKLNVSADGYTSVKAQDITPEFISVSSIDTFEGRDVDGFQNVQFEVDWTDPQGSNYYMVEVFARYSFVEDEYEGFNLYMNSFDPNISNSQNGFWGNRILIKDENFDGKDYKLRFGVDAYVMRDTFVREIQLKFSSVSEAVYNYYSSYQLYQQTNGNFFATPVQVFSNVENGRGIFGGAATRVESVVKRD